MTKVELTIQMELENFDARNQRWVQFAIAAFLEISPNDVRILGIERSSVKATVELPTKSEKKLLSAYKRDDSELAEFLAPLVLLDLRRVPAERKLKRFMPTCPICRSQHAESELLGPDGRRIANVAALRPLPGKILLCPRCKTDIYSWRPAANSVTPILRRPFPLIVPLLALVQGAFTHWMPHLIGVILAVVLSVVVFFVLQDKAKDFRITKWARPFKKKPGPSLEIIEVGAFLAGLAMALVTIVLIKYWILPPAGPSFEEKLITSLTYSLSFVFITVALTALLVKRQVSQLNKFMPQPVFTNTALLLRIVMNSAKKQIDLIGDAKVESVERTDDAGIQVVVSLKRKVTTTEKTGKKKAVTEKQGRRTTVTSTEEEEEKVSQKEEKGSVARWAIKADMWARIRSIDVRDWWTFVQ